MKRGMVVGVASAAIVVAGLAGCSNSKSNTSSPSATGAAGAPQVIVDGQNQNVTGQVSCTAAGDNINIGIGDPSTGVGAVVTNTNPPAVHSVGLGSVNGVVLGYSDAASNQAANATATQNGKTYKITGTAAGVDVANSQQAVTKSFEMDMTCP